MKWLSDAIDRVGGFLPELVGGLLVLAIGWLLASVLRRVTRPLLHRIGFDRLLANNEVIADERKQTGSRAGANAVYWVVLAVALLQATRIWRLGLVADGMARIIAFLPNVLAAVLIFGAAFIVASLVRRRMLVGERLGADTIVAGGVRAGLLTFGAFLALRQLRIGEEILVIAFALTFGAIALAVALAFGLGSRSVAGRIAQDWYERRTMPTGRRVVVEEPQRPPQQQPPS